MCGSVQEDEWSLRLAYVGLGAVYDRYEYDYKDQVEM